MPRAPQKDAPAAPVQRRWLDPDEAAAYLGVTRRWLERRREERNGPRFHKPTSMVIRYDLADLDAYMTEQAVEQEGRS